MPCTGRRCHDDSTLTKAGVVPSLTIYPCDLRLLAAVNAVYRAALSRRLDAVRNKSCVAALTVLLSPLCCPCSRCRVQGGAASEGGALPGLRAGGQAGGSSNRQYSVYINHITILYIHIICTFSSVVPKWPAAGRPPSLHTSRSTSAPRAATCLAYGMWAWSCSGRGASKCSSLTASSSTWLSSGASSSWCASVTQTQHGLGL